MVDDRISQQRYIAFEGVEGAGKSSVARAVATNLDDLGESVVTVREPGGTPVGEAVRDILLSGEVHPRARAEASLFAAARAQLMAEIVRPALDAGAWVVSDRSVYSSLAYQAGGRGLPLEEVRTLNDIALAGLWPSTVVLLRVDAEDGLARQSVADRIGGESDAFFADVVEMFDALADAEPERFLVVNARQPLDSVIADVLDGLEMG